MLTMRLPLWRIMVALLLAVGLAGCSAIKLGYNNLPHLAYWWLDDYVDFTGEQSGVVRQELARLHGWHRSQELPLLHALVGRARQLAAGPVTPQQACAVADDARLRLQAVATHAQPQAARLAATLQPRQLAHLQRKYLEKNAEFTSEWVELAAGARVDKRLEGVVKRAEDFYGRLQPAQLELLRAALERSAWDPRRVLAERQRRQQDLLQTLRSVQQRPAQAEPLLQAYLLRTLQSPDPGYRAAQQQWLQEHCTMVAALHQSASPAQRERALRRLQAYQGDIEALARQAPGEVETGVSN